MELYEKAIDKGKDREHSYLSKSSASSAIFFGQAEDAKENTT